jgi:hypothetical protein
MDAELMEALAEILADALLADLEGEMEEEQIVAVTTAVSPTGSNSRKDQDQLLAVSDLSPVASHSSNPSDLIAARN